MVEVISTIKAKFATLLEPTKKSKDNETCNQDEEDILEDMPPIEQNFDTNLAKKRVI
jgi:hypothetical protein